MDIRAAIGKVRAVLDFAQAKLQGEPLRAIGYGAGVAIYAAAKVSGTIPDVALDQALLQGAGIAATLVTVVEAARRFVYSPLTVAAIVNELNADKPDPTPEEIAPPVAADAVTVGEDGTEVAVPPDAPTDDVADEAANG